MGTVMGSDSMIGCLHSRHVIITLNDNAHVVHLSHMAWLHGRMGTRLLVLNCSMHIGHSVLLTLSTTMRQKRRCGAATSSEAMSRLIFRCHAGQIISMNPTRTPQPELGALADDAHLHRHQPHLALHCFDYDLHSSCIEFEFQFT